MKIHDPADNMLDAVNDVLATGVAAIEGTKSPATTFAERVLTCLKDYPEVDPAIGHQIVLNAGYLYCVADADELGIGSDDLKERIRRIDASNPHSED